MAWAATAARRAVRRAALADRRAPAKLLEEELATARTAMRGEACGEAGRAQGKGAG